jgi:hypothetical protein
MSILLEFLFDYIFAGILRLTGEAVLFAVTFGRRKPQWKRSLDETDERRRFLGSPVLWTGLAFWVLVLFLLSRIASLWEG